MTLLDRTTELYWSFAEYGIDDRRRMKAVLYSIAAEIRTWAPRKEEAKICFLAINEIADRILRECNENENFTVTAVDSAATPEVAGQS